jgi:hypothetical protein
LAAGYFPAAGLLPSRNEESVADVGLAKCLPDTVAIEFLNCQEQCRFSPCSGMLT